jgi:succinyl-CoA synthetase beta subunit
LFRKHGVPVPDGRHAATVPEAVEAADELGFPVVIKAQVQIGGRGKAERSGVRVGRNPTQVSEIAVEILRERV